MADIDFDDRFITAVNTNGEKQRIPGHWIGHPVLGAGFRPAPSQAARDAARTQDSGPAEVPDDTWSLNALRGYAARNAIDLGDSTTKAQILATLAALDTQTPDVDQTPDETPAAGDEKEN